MRRAWSKQIEQRYHLRLPPQLISWFDDEMWRHRGPCEFHDALAAEQLLDPPPGVIWAGFMLPDTLPLLGNDYGDWLCMRVAPDGGISEIIGWNHGGGDWIPYGQDLAEAVLYDTACSVSTDGAHKSVNVSRGELFDSPIVRWACDWIARSHGPLRGLASNGALGGESDADRLLAAGIAEAVIRRDRTLAHLDSLLKACSDHEVAQRFDVRWEPDFVRWIFDTELIPLAARDDLTRLFAQPPERLLAQDWKAAEREALVVTQRRQDLGWAFDIAGWAAERCGDAVRAIDLYARGLRTSVFADETIRFRTHWFPEGFGKFAAARLADLRDQVPRSLQNDSYLDIFWQNDASTLRMRLRDYWQARAEKYFSRAQYMQAYHCYYHAGWDCGLSDLDGYAEILDGLGASAAAGSVSALASIADTHRRFLPNRNSTVCEG
jgi:hypothetical protein